jgi:hypothetical protein
MPALRQSGIAGLWGKNTPISPRSYLLATGFVWLGLLAALLLFALFVLAARSYATALSKESGFIAYLCALCLHYPCPLLYPNLAPSAIIMALTAVIALVWRFISPRHAAAVVLPYACAVILVGDLLYFGMQYNPFVPSSLIYPKTDVSELLKQRLSQDPSQSLPRICGVDTPWSNPWKGDCFPPATALPYGLPDVRGKDGMYPERTRKFMARIQPELFSGIPFEASVHFIHCQSKLLDLVGMRYVVTPHDLKGPQFQFIRRPLYIYFYPLGMCYAAIQAEIRHPLLLSALVNAGVYENRAALPRAFVVHKARVITDLPSMDRLLHHDRRWFNPALEVLLEEEPYGFPLETPGKGPDFGPAIVEHSPTRVVVEVDLKSPGFLVLADTCYPGWQVTVDGVRTRLLAADLLLRCVPLNEGRHRVEFSYNPWSFTLGALLSLLTLVSVPLLVFALRRQAS